MPHNRTITCFVEEALDRFVPHLSRVFVSEAQAHVLAFALRNRGSGSSTDRSLGGGRRRYAESVQDDAQFSSSLNADKIVLNHQTPLLRGSMPLQYSRISKRCSDLCPVQLQLLFHYRFHILSSSPILLPFLFVCLFCFVIFFQSLFPSFAAFFSSAPLCLHSFPQKHQNINHDEILIAYHPLRKNQSPSLFWSVCSRICAKFENIDKSSSSAHLFYFKSPIRSSNPQWKTANTTAYPVAQQQQTREQQ